ncbi:MAG: TAT-variant-translocated molybdopterin oxidoreductase [Candidatus Kapaibacterium sp.]|nr:TAT-variant-translocated molybdopterin oxidoreductase [Ignavibacteriota bacterium]MCB9220285.1 TAT-variant-translocated molybdopterin oxidoreductase [Ignavibacteria bacterium]
MNNSVDKNKNQIDLPVVKSDSKPSVWRSLDEYDNTNSDNQLKVKANEFADGAENFDISSKSKFSRRKFMALMSASSAMAMAACTDYRDKGEIVPYIDKPEEVIPGIPNFYASTLISDGSGQGVLVKTREGRPILIEGNPQHPISKGKLDSNGIARLLDMYDPNRLQNPRKLQESKLVDTDWGTVDKEIIQSLNSASSSGKEIALFTGKIISPTFAKLIEDFKAKYPTTKVYSHELFNDNNKQEAWNKSTGGTTYPLIHLDKASIILSIDSDFLGTDGNVNENIRQFVVNRDFENPANFSRFYQVEGSYTLTGSNADYRLRLTPENYLDVIASLVNHFAAKQGKQTMSGFKSLEALAKENHWKHEAVSKLINDLESNRGKAIVIGGKQLSVDHHIAINYLNELIGANELYNKSESDYNVISLSNDKEISSLASRMKSGNVGVLINIDKNPTYHLPKLFSKENLSKVKTVVSLNEFENETTNNSNYVLGINHDIESWGDAKIRTGVISTQQPVIAPLYNTRQKEAILLNWINNVENYSEDVYHKYLQSNWETNIYPSLNRSVPFKEFWFATLHDGVTTFNETSIVPTEFDVSTVNSIKPTKKSNYSVILQENYFIRDGRYAGNGFLQESAHPITKVTWDNCAMVSPATSKELGVEIGDMLEVTLNGVAIELPTLIQPGMAEKVIAVDLGYGRTNSSPIGNGVGFDVTPFMSEKGISNWIYTGASVKSTGNKYELVSTQEHHALDDEFLRTQVRKDEKGNVIGGDETFARARGIIQESTVEGYLKNPRILKEHTHKVFSITKDFEYNNMKWAMSIDMNKCIGCNACSIACYVENNIPVVGKEEVGYGREMGWMRIDRYFAGTPDDPIMSNQPMLCQHCDNAPCENVCPVVATTHSQDGLNQMVYNRCVGTRYCANNCPYKVRRFNFYDFRDNLANGYYKTESTKIMMNPEVTIRARGVMEKCTFCVQRISEAKQKAKEEGRALKGSDVTTACQDACPANAIEFGNANDKDSRLAMMRDHNLGYHVLDYLNVKPNVTYLAKLRNSDSLGVKSEHH